MTQQRIILAFTFLVVSTFAAAQMQPGSPVPPGGTMGPPGTSRGQQLPGVGEPGLGGTAGIPEDKQQQKQTTAAQVDDGTLERQLHEEFTRNADMAGVQVHVEKGVVTLQGTVPNKEDKKKAKQIAESVPGVRKVREKLSVKPGGPSASSNSDTLGIDTGSVMTLATPLTASTCRCNPNGAGALGASPVASPPGTLASVPAMATQVTCPCAGYPVNSAIAQNSSGAADRSGAADTTTEQSGSPSSRGLVTVPDDASLQGQIQTAFKNDPTLANENVNVNVTEETIELSGSVPTGKAKQTAERITESYEGNRKVIDHITIAGRGPGPSASSNSAAAAPSGSRIDITGAPQPSPGNAGTAGPGAGASGSGSSTTGTPPPPSPR